jgi:hypothetical protein
MSRSPVRVRHWLTQKHTGRQRQGRFSRGVLHYVGRRRYLSFNVRVKYSADGRTSSKGERLHLDGQAGVSALMGHGVPAWETFPI